MTPLQRIKIVLDFYHSRGVNKESVNSIYRKLLIKEFSRN
jgi:hypothetical protein